MSRIFERDAVADRSPFASKRLGCRWPPVSPPCVLGWVTVGHPIAQGHGSVTFLVTREEMSGLHSPQC